MTLQDRLRNRAALNISLLTITIGAIAMACSGSSANSEQPLLCGPGAIEQAHRCLALDGGRGVPFPTDAGDELSDATPADTFVDDASNTVDAPGPSQLPDACPRVDRPIPEVMAADCNPNHDCGSAENHYRACRAASCVELDVSGTDLGPIPIFGSGGKSASIVRTPDQPGWNSGCAKCGADSFAYAIAVKVPNSGGGAYRIEVSPPWVIYLQDMWPDGSARLKRCPAEMKASLGNSYVNGVGLAQWFLIATRDSNAPARNVYIYI